MKYYLLTLMLFVFNYIKAQEKVNDTNKFVKEFTVNYYSNDSKKLSESDIHVFLIERKKIGKEPYCIFSIGLNKSGVPDVILIYNISNPLNNSVEIIGDLDLKSNMLKMYRFFEEHKQFSNNSKVVCYEKLIAAADVSFYKKRR